MSNPPGLCLRSLVAEAGYPTCNAFARAAGVMPSRFSEYVRGVAPWRPTPRIARRVAITARVPLEDAYEAFDLSRARRLERDRAAAELAETKRVNKRGTTSDDLPPE